MKNTESNKTMTFSEEEAEEEAGEDWCFECKDGGQMVICDFHDCGKVYHPDCIGKDDSSLNTAELWYCGRHFCFDCKDLSKYYCIGCPNGVCRKCLTASEFTVVRGVKCLCVDCLELVKIIEQKLDHDSEGNKITLDDRETYECLFKEYWEIIKVKEGLTSDDIFAAQPTYKKGKSVQHGKKNCKGEEEEEKENDSTSWDSDQVYKPRKRKRYNSVDFQGCGSKHLISFLASIGKHETEPLTPSSVNSVIHEYIKENNLHHPIDKDKFLPDERAKVDSDDSGQRKSYHLVRVLGTKSHTDVVFDEMSNGILLQVSFMAKAVPISELSDEDFTEKECGDLRQKVKASLLSKLTVVEVQEKAKFLHEDITKHRIRTRLLYLQNQIDRANLRGRKEKEQLEQSWKQEQLLRSEPSVCPELNEPNYDDSEEGELEIDTQDQLKDVCSLQKNKITLDGREAYECRFKDWEITKVKEGLTSDDIFASQHNCKTGKKICKSEEKQNDSMSWSWASDEDNKPAQQKRNNSEEFVGWGSKPLISFLASIGKYETEPLAQWDVNSIIHEYIKEKNLDHPRDKGKFFPDERLFPIFRKKVISKRCIYSLLGIHFAKELDDSPVEKNDDQIRNSSTNKHLNNQATCMESRLSSLIEKPLLKKGDFFIKHSRFASINTVDSNDSRERNSHHLLRVLGVEFDEMINGTLLQVSFMAKAIPISKLSNEDFTEEECEELRQKVNSNLLPKLTVVEVQEKAKILLEDIAKHRILTRLVYLQNQIERANLRGQEWKLFLDFLWYTKIALLEEKEKLEQSWKQEELLRREPSVRAELIEAKYDDSEIETKIDKQDQ
ncbi:hypothetical protein VNO78_18516 [Psophocarpus tetragonolobus]|uniref:DM2 domain-containing protein n=1 Tax=Psophocarpus tetragonolobus TaxID=3891 RepID=A0AAN9XLL2_PSOTE